MSAPHSISGGDGWERVAGDYRAARDALDVALGDSQAEVKRLREAIEAHKTATRYNPRAPWVNARLWDEAGLGDA